MVPAPARRAGGVHIDAFRPARDLILFLEHVISLFGPAWRRHEELGPYAVAVADRPVHRAVEAPGMRIDGDVIGLGQGADFAQLAHAAAPGDIRLPDR